MKVVNFSYRTCAACPFSVKINLFYNIQIKCTVKVSVTYIIPPGVN